MKITLNQLFIDFWEEEKKMQQILKSFNKGELNIDDYRKLYFFRKTNIMLLSRLIFYKFKEKSIKRKFGNDYSFLVECSKIEK